MKPLHILALAALALLYPLFLRPASADTLLDVVSSSDMELLNHGSGRSEESWFENRPNLLKLFREDRDGQMLNQWVGGSVTAGYTPQRIFYDRTSMGITFARKYRVTSGVPDVTIDIFVPHPSKAILAENRLITELNAFEPPKLHIKSMQEIEVQGRMARLFEKAAGGCSLLIKLPSNAVLNLSAPDIQSSDRLIDLAGRLDITRLEAKLKS